ncbi:MAG: YdcF family protein [Magnetococcales bacterium]|nr:YdcF family protein [Magnetococcales bacterium]
MNPLLNRFLEQWVLPPGVILTGLLLAIAMLGLKKSTFILWRVRTARILLWITFGLSYVAMLPITANWVAETLEPPGRYPAMTQERLQQVNAQAIVVFGYGRARLAPEYDNQDTLLPGGLARARYAAHLYKQTHLPILVAGGRPYGEERSEAEIMRDVLVNEFNTPVQWLDETSRDTRENAANATAILQAVNIKRILLVIHNRDVSRALLSFQQAAGETIQVIPAPILFRPKMAYPFSWEATDLIQWIPNADALSLLSVGLHEWLGKIWYQLRH